MANAALQGQYYPIDDTVMQHLLNTYDNYKETPGKGTVRLKGLVTNRQVSYEQLKRMKNYFDYLDYDNMDDQTRIQYEIQGGDMMRDWVNSFLEQLRTSVSNKNQTRADTAMLQQSDVTAPDLNPEKHNDRGPMDMPDLMSSNDLMEQVTKMRYLIKVI